MLLPGAFLLDGARAEPGKGPGPQKHSPICKLSHTSGMSRLTLWGTHWASGCQACHSWAVRTLPQPCGLDVLLRHILFLAVTTRRGETACTECSCLPSRWYEGTDGRIHSPERSEKIPFCSFGGRLRAGKAGTEGLREHTYPGNTSPLFWNLSWSCLSTPVPVPRNQPGSA